MKAVIPAGGNGTRMFDRTNNGQVSKEALPINGPAPQMDGDRLHVGPGLSQIEYSIMRLAASGITDITVVSGTRKEDLNEIVRRLAKDPIISEMLNIELVMQTTPRGLGDAFQYGVVGRGAGTKPNKTADQPVAYIGVLPDDLLVTDDFQNLSCPVVEGLVAIVNAGGNGVATMEVPDHLVSSYGIVDYGRERDGQSHPILGFVEKPRLDDAPSNFAIAGMYGFQPSMVSAVDRTPPDHKGEVQITNAMELSLEEGHEFHDVAIGGRVTRHDVGRPEGYDEFRAYVGECESRGIFMGDLRMLCRSLQATQEISDARSGLA